MSRSVVDSLVTAPICHLVFTFSLEFFIKQILNYHVNYLLTKKKSGVPANVEGLKKIYRSKIHYMLGNKNSR